MSPPTHSLSHSFVIFLSSLTNAFPHPPIRFLYFTTNRYAVCTSDFGGEQEGDLALYEGDEVILLRKIDADWYEGECNGTVGMFPAAFVDVQVEVPT